MSSWTATPTELYVPGVSRAVIWTVLVKIFNTGHKIQESARAGLFIPFFVTPPPLSGAGGWI